MSIMERTLMESTLRGVAGKYFYLISKNGTYFLECDLHKELCDLIESDEKFYNKIPKGYIDKFKGTTLMVPMILPEKLDEEFDPHHKRFEKVDGKQFSGWYFLKIELWDDINTMTYSGIVVPELIANECNFPKEKYFPPKKMIRCL